MLKPCQNTSIGCRLKFLKLSLPSAHGYILGLEILGLKQPPLNLRGLSLNSHFRKVIGKCTRCRFLCGKIFEQDIWPAYLPNAQKLNLSSYTNDVFFVMQDRKQKRYVANYAYFSLKALHIETVLQ